MGKPYVALLWHHHQPPYADPESGGRDLVLPWVRLHAARDYYQMAYLVAQHPGLYVTFNLTPVLLAQLDAYLEAGARDRLMDLSRRDPRRLKPEETDALLGCSFDVDLQNQIRVHPRYFKLFRKYCRRETFTPEEITDAVALFNLAWVGEIFRGAPVALETGAVVELGPLFERGGGYTAEDVEAVIAAQLEIMRAVVPLHRRLYHEGRIELTATPYYHPILPLLHNSDHATIDRPGSRHPARFSWPADAREQVSRAAALFERTFGGAPAGMWPAEGAVGEAVLPYFEEAGVAWIASDEGVLARSGPAGFDVARPEVLFRPYRVGGGDLAVFFRHRGLSDAIGFFYQHWRDAEHAAADFLKQLRALLAVALSRSARDALATVILDGENAWGAYRRHGVPFLNALYRALAAGGVARTVTFRQYLEGVPERDVAPHPSATLAHVDELACASWIDEAGSLPGNDMGTWIGGSEENRAWEVLGKARVALAAAPAGRPGYAEARENLLAAEASDWFWWYGDDQGGGADEEFDRLFRSRVRKAYKALGLTPPADLDEPIAPRRVVWRRDVPLKLAPGDLLVVEWPEPGDVRFGVNGWQHARQRPLVPSHGVMGKRDSLYRAPLLRIAPDVRRVEFTFCDPEGRWLGYDFFVPAT